MKGKGETYIIFLECIFYTHYTFSHIFHIPLYTFFFQLRILIHKEKKFTYMTSPVTHRKNGRLKVRKAFDNAQFSVRV